MLTKIAQSAGHRWNFPESGLRKFERDNGRKRYRYLLHNMYRA